jgi:methylmalonyl-CoA/ethylmalonyl-CoA epimerase
MSLLKRFDHVSVAVQNIDEGYRIFRDILGGKLVTPRVRSYDGQFSWTDMLLAGVKLELIQPEGKDSFVQRFLNENGSKVHHLTFEVDNLDRSVSQLEAAGLSVVGRTEEDPDWKMAFIHPKSAKGVLIQIYEPKVKK